MKNPLKKTAKAVRNAYEKLKGSKAEPHFLFGKDAPNPARNRNLQRMMDTGRSWFWISKAPIYLYNEIGLPEFSKMSKGYSMKETDAKPQTAKRIRAKAKAERRRNLLSMFLPFLFLLTNFAGTAQSVLVLNIGTDPANAQFCYQSHINRAEIILPGLALSVVGDATHEVYYPKAIDVEQGCVISEERFDGEPIFWVYWLRRGAEIHIPAIGAVYVTGQESDLFLAPRPACAIMLEQQHKNVVEKKRKYSPTVTN